ncbi:iron-dicitrate ABC transporter ATP-binding protein [Paenibacillus naphthalenovorans]|uniref:ABC transporter ATP-binding protein n=1 Tax=Paenibacillus naphthalenovorans TaxID=162209 RepID=UPI0010BAD47E|nr:ABC transporter ATP-binding protein [Paenibacillus naphthalenovorans]GCL71186.1 iron-dicitrate ABC transporter ATP-binding protein [Paenibacillus naphthalenovorans]
MTAIQTNHMAFHAGAFRLHDISLSIPSECMTAIVGPNGSGKSTLLKLMSQLLLPDQGEIYIRGKQAKTYPAIALAKIVSMLTQSKHSLPDMTVRELVSYGRSPYKRLFDRMTADDERIVDWAMEVTGTKRHEQRMFHTLSGGEQQKARIAMALAQKTSIILLDEPTTFLDIAHQLDVMEMLQKINREYRITIVMVLHDLQQAARYCHYMIAVKNGKIMTTGKPKDIINPAFLKEVYQIEAKVTFADEYLMIIPVKTLESI